jgi:hypothetical protein
MDHRLYLVINFDNNIDINEINSLLKEVFLKSENHKSEHF